MFDPFSAAEAVENIRDFVRAVGIGEYGNRVPYDLRSGIPEVFLRSAIPTANDAIQILADDGVLLGPVIQRHL